MKLFLRLMKNRVYNFIEKNNMLDCANLIVGLSGGADSICLISILKDYIKEKNLDINLIAVHVNHGIRDEAIDDENFVSLFCKNNNIKLKVIKIDCIALAKERGLTVEEAGRLKRYEIFNDLASELANAKIAVAHHKNDQAETVLMNLSRGSSISGLRGIKPVRDNIIRPLLVLRRSEIEEYLEKNGLEYVTDKTNFDNDYTRNAIRNVIIPSLETKVNKAAVDNIAAMADRLLKIEDFLKISVKKAMDDLVSFSEDAASINLKRIDDYHDYIIESLIYHLIAKLANKRKDIYAVNVNQVKDLIKAETSKRVYLPYNLIAVRNYNSIDIRKNVENKGHEASLEDLIHLNKKDIKNELIINKEFSEF